MQVRREALTARISPWLALAGWLWLAGCGGEATQPAESTEALPPPQVAETAVPPTSPSLAVPAAAPAEPPGEPPYAYWPGNRRDPFRSVIVSSGKQMSDELLPPLQQYAVSDLKLVAILWG